MLADADHLDNDNKLQWTEGIYMCIMDFIKSFDLLMNGRTGPCLVSLRLLPAPINITSSGQFLFLGYELKNIIMSCQVS